MWPAATEKDRYKDFENKACQALYKMTKSAEDKVAKLTNSIYDMGEKLSSVKDGTRLTKEKCGPSKRVKTKTQQKEQNCRENNGDVLRKTRTWPSNQSPM